MLFAILARYLHSRITLASWNVRYGRSTSGGTGGTGTGTGTNTARLRKRTIYDNWLVLRFAIAFVALRSAPHFSPPLPPLILTEI